MAKTKKELLKEAKKLGLDLDSKLTNKEIAAAIDAAAKPPAPPEPPKQKPAIELDIEATVEISAAALLPIVEGFESEVAQLKHLEQKFNNPSKNPKVLERQYASQKAIVNGILAKLNVKV